jgi:peptide/nickel transport system permease protein
MITLTPGDPVEIMLADQRATAEQAEALRRDLGLDRPLVERFLVFLGNALRGDFGISFFHRRPVWDVIAERLPATVELTLVALVVAILVAIPFGVIAAVKRDSWIDRALSAASLFGVSLPGFWFGILLILLGVVGYIASGAASITALIPAFLGAPVLAAGVLALNEARRKHAMHAAAALALLGVLGTVRALTKLPALLSGGEVARPAAVVAQLVMLVLSAVFLALCIRSFIEARKKA